MHQVGMQFTSDPADIKALSCRVVGQNIKRRRIECKFKQGAFAALIGVSEPIVRRIEQGRREVPVSLLQTIADKQGIDDITWYTIDRGPINKRVKVQAE